MNIPSYPLFVINYTCTKLILLMNDSFFEQRSCQFTSVFFWQVLLCCFQAITKELSVIHHKFQFITLFTIHKYNVVKNFLLCLEYENV